MSCASLAVEGVCIILEEGGEIDCGDSSAEILDVDGRPFFCAPFEPLESCW